MAFQIRYDNGGGPVTYDVWPAPERVEYPPRRIVNSRKSVDNKTIIQRPLLDDRPRKWLWFGYRDTIPGYTALWNVLKDLDVKVRLANGWNPLVEVKDDVSGKGGFDTFKFVKVIQADRMPEAGGPVTYAETFIEFIIEDASYTEF